MSDELDDFIRDNQNEFDRIEQPDVEAFWTDFQEAKPKRRLFAKRWSLGIAAAILLLIGMFVLNQNKEIKRNLVIEDLEIDDPYLSEYKAILVSTLAAQDSLIKSMEISPEDHQEIFEQLEQLDEVVAQYREDLKKYGPSKKIIKNLLFCAKQRIQLYEILLHEIELKNNYEELDKETNI
ncbi:MAG: hypothetical protein AB8F74_00785 [Saprospiraceae bacterium]